MHRTGTDRAVRSEAANIAHEGKGRDDAGCQRIFRAPGQAGPSAVPPTSRMAGTGGIIPTTLNYGGGRYKPRAAAFRSARGLWRSPQWAFGSLRCAETGRWLDLAVCRVRQGNSI